MANKNTGKTMIAIFKSEIPAPNGTQQGLTIATIGNGTDAGRTWCATTICFDQGRMVLLRTTDASNPPYELLGKLFPEVGQASIDRAHTIAAPAQGGPVIKLVARLDENSLALDAAQVRPAKLTDTDLTNGGSTLKAFLGANGYDLDASIVDPTIDLSIRPMAFFRDKTDYAPFWNSNVITDEEKQACTPMLSLDICMSNAKRSCFKIFDKVMSTEYLVKSFTAVGMHGPQGGGKSQMVSNWCALKHIPLVAIPCDPMMSITQILGQVGPQQRQAAVDKKELVTLVEGLKAELLLLQNTREPADQDEADKLQERKRSVLEALDRAANLGKEVADLVKTPSVLMKCLKHNLPLVVFLDEANLASTTFQNSLAPIISDGIYKDGPITGRNTGTIKWVLAWNPQTSNVKSFDGKFFDRLFFIQVPELSDTEKQDYDNRMLAAKMFQTGAPNMEPLNKWAAKMKKSVEEPVLQDIVAKASAMFDGKTSGEAVAWYADYLLKEKFPPTPTFKEGEFTAAYADDVQLAGLDAAKQARALNNALVKMANTELRALTMGKDIKNPDKYSYYYISDRNRDIFQDLILSYSSVTTGLTHFIYNLIPGGGTIKLGAATPDPLNDTTPAVIAATVVSKLEALCDTTQTALFSPTTVATAAPSETSDQLIAGNAWDESLWKVATPDSGTPNVTTQHSSVESDNYADELLKNP